VRFGVRMIELPKCSKRRKVDCVWMCHAIGCCEIGDMACECDECFVENGYMCKNAEMRRNDEAVQCELHWT